MSSKRGRYPDTFIARSVRLVDAGGKISDVARLREVSEDLLVRWVAQHRMRDDGEESYWLAWMTRQFAERFDFEDGKGTIFVQRKGLNQWYLMHSAKGYWNEGWEDDDYGTAQLFPLVEALKLALQEIASAEVAEPASLFSEVAHG